ncbi:MAG: peptide-methionine (R)-S-oxide reductase MsrB [Acaryochloridaceae cyanobacterium CSU_5_19]|nr:peptide-methionine (R)-S-oxide reductase MsrB [Acaryochloridaceae cyanobacterium CSU_5_19]
MKKRNFLIAGTGILGLAWLWRYTPWATSTLSGRAETFEVTKTEAEWRELLPAPVFKVLRQHSTEQPGTSPLDHEFGKGTYTCAGCDLPLFTSATKFNSGTGWPSFYDPIAGAIGTADDRSMIISRTEVHCRRCGGHLGHVFADGPPPTGKRYCMNGLALKFIPA